MAGEISSFLGGFGGATIGSAVVKLFLDSDQYRAQLATAGKDVDGFGATTSKVTAAASLAWAAAGTAVISFVGDSIAAFNEAEAAMAQTEAVIKSTGGAAGFTAEEIADLAHGFQETTAFSDEAVQSMQNVLLTFTRIGHDEVPVATQAILDYSTAMGKDLNSAAVQVGKALNDPIKGIAALARGGTQFSAEQIELIKGFVEQNDLMSAQRIILDELADQYGGSAAAALDTFAGKQQQLNNKFNDFQERVGGVATTSVVGMVDAIGGWIRTNEVLNSALSTTGAATDDMASSTDIAADAVRDAANAFSQAAAMSSDATKKIRQFANLTGEELKDWRNEIIENIRDTFGTISQFDNQWTISARQFQRNADKMAEQSAQLTEDLEVLATSNISDAIKKALLDEGPAAVHAFVESNRKGREAIVDDLKASQSEFREQKKLIEEMTGKIDVLGKTKAEATVNIKYTSSGIPLDVLKNLPGIGDEG